MTEEAAPLNESQKCRALRRIQRTLDHEEHPTLRACGLTEEVALALATESPPGQVVNLWIVADEGSVLDRCRVDTISEEGLAILARADDEPLRVVVEHPKRSTSSLLLSAMGSSTKAVLGAILTGVVALVVAWILYKKGWQ